MQLKSELEDSDFPQELVDSALNTLVNVFQTFNKSKVQEDPKAGQFYYISLKSFSIDSIKNIASENADEAKVEEKAIETVVNQEVENTNNQIKEEVQNAAQNPVEG